MNIRRRLVQLGLVLLVALSLSPLSRAQDEGAQVQGVDSGNYNVQQTIDFGYRASEMNGNMNTYNTFVNLNSGVRLFDYTLNMRSLNHEGLLFDNLHFSNFGYGGDPDDVSRLHIDKNKWYDFNFTFRRHVNFWDYNLWSNPLNPAAYNAVGTNNTTSTGCYVGGNGQPAYCSSPAIAITNSPHALNLVRRMQDYDLTLLPQSRVRFRLGYSHIRDEGPGFLTGDIGGTIPDFPESYSYTTNGYHVGVDFRLLPRTTISYDQFLNYVKVDNTVLASATATPGLFSDFQVADGTPVYMGMIWSTSTPGHVAPCSAANVDTTTSPATVGTSCNGYVYYSENFGRPRNFMPTERVRFESTYFQKLEMSGSFGYSSSSNKIPDFNQYLIGWTSRTSSPGSTASGPAKVTRVSVDGNWAGIYSVTEKFRIVDYFHYYNWRIPGYWNSMEGALFNTTQGTGLGAPVGFFDSSCTVANSYSASTCPNHTANSGADVTNAYNANFLKQDMKTNTFKLVYDFTPRINAYLGYLFQHRQIVSYADPGDLGSYAPFSYMTSEIYYPGGAGATAANYYLAARGDCAVLEGGGLPADCTLNSDGSITFTAPPLTTAPPFYSLGVNENSLLAGFSTRPIDSLHVAGDFEFGYNDAAYTRVSPRQVQSYAIHATYSPVKWASVDGAIVIDENRDNVDTVNNLEHNRMYSFTTMLAPDPQFAVSFGYNYWDIYEQTAICFNYSVSPAGSSIATPPGVNTVACPIPGASVGGSGLGTLSTYASQDHFAHAEVMWKPTKRVSTALGYGGSFVRGNTTMLNPLTPDGTLDYNYQMPYGSVTIQVYRGFSYKMAWNYYGFTETGVTNPFGLATIPLQDFNGSNATFSFRYAF
jgi:hypothetical protein